jgi:hypothetical protein
MSMSVQGRASGRGRATPTRGARDVSPQRLQRPLLGSHPCYPAAGAWRTRSRYRARCAEPRGRRCGAWRSWWRWQRWRRCPRQRRFRPCIPEAPGSLSLDCPSAGGRVGVAGLLAQGALAVHPGCRARPSFARRSGFECRSGGMQAVNRWLRRHWKWERGNEEELSEVAPPLPDPANPARNSCGEPPADDPRALRPGHAGASRAERRPAQRTAPPLADRLPRHGGGGGGGRAIGRGAAGSQRRRGGPKPSMYARRASVAGREGAPRRAPARAARQRVRRATRAGRGAAGRRRPGEGGRGGGGNGSRGESGSRGGVLRDVLPRPGCSGPHRAPPPCTRASGRAEPAVSVGTKNLRTNTRRPRTVIRT